MISKSAPEDILDSLKPSSCIWFEDHYVTTYIKSSMSMAQFINTQSNGQNCITPAATHILAALRIQSHVSRTEDKTEFHEETQEKKRCFLRQQPPKKE